MASVTIDGKTFFSYATVDDANTYFAADFGSTWPALDPTEKARALVSSTRFLDRQAFRVPFESPDDRATEPKIVEAAIVLAGLIASDEAGFITTGSTAATSKRFKAGSVEIENFASYRQAPAMPAVLLGLLSEFLLAPAGRSGLALGGAAAYGTDCVSDRGKSYGFSRDV